MSTIDPHESHLTNSWMRHRAELVRYVTGLLSGDRYAAEDVVQETAIRLWSRPDVLTDGRPLGAWLRTVARNLVIDRARRRAARPSEVAVSLDSMSDVLWGHEDVDANAVVADLLSCLSPQHRTVVLEVYVHDRSVADVAAELGVSPGTVKSRCYYARARLRSVLTAGTAPAGGADRTPDAASGCAA